MYSTLSEQDNSNAHILEQEDKSMLNLHEDNPSDILSTSQIPQ